MRQAVRASPGRAVHQHQVGRVAQPGEGTEQLAPAAGVVLVHRLDAARRRHQAQSVRPIQHDFVEIPFALQQVQQFVARPQPHHLRQVAARGIEQHHALPQLRQGRTEVQGQHRLRPPLQGRGQRQHAQAGMGEHAAQAGRLIGAPVPGISHGPPLRSTASVRHPQARTATRRRLPARGSPAPRPPAGGYPRARAGRRSRRPASACDA